MKDHVKDDWHPVVQHIRCLETAQRDYQPPTGRMRPFDTIRLEVLTLGGKRAHRIACRPKFSERHPLSYAGGGVLGNGFFDMYLRDILVSENVSIEDKGEEEIGGRRPVRFDDRLPVVWSGQTIQTLEGSGQVGLRGSY